MRRHPRLAGKSAFVCSAVALVLGGAASGSAQGAGYWHTSGTKILDANGTQIRIAGINWYGFETTRAVAGGLTSQDYKSILSTIKNLGYNTIRVPMSNQMVETPSVPSSISYGNGMNADLNGLNSLQILDKIVSEAGTLGLQIILDNHRSEAGDSAESSGLWYTGSYPESAWINDWTSLATRYLNNPTVIGFDLRNEPHNAASGGACWDCGGVNDWHLAAARAGNAILAVNPKLLIFVEGTDGYNNDFYWWGGNLEGVQNSPVKLNVANQLVYSAHDYGPSVYGQPWFNGSTTYASLATVWTNHWAYVEKNGIAPVWLGEFCTPNDAASVQSKAAGSEGQWFQSLVQFLGADFNLSWTYWALNGEDALALLDSNYDASPVSSTKQGMLAGIQFPLSAGTTTAPAAPSNLTALATSASTVKLSWTASSSSGVTYTVYDGMSSGSTTSVLASGLAATSFSASGLNASTTYYFTVKAVSGGGSSAASNQASAATQAAAAPAPPSGLTATAASPSQINLAWTASATPGVTYSVYSGTASGATAKLLAGGLSTTNYSAAGLTASTTYYFTVKAVNAGGTSPVSNQASATTQAAGSGGASCHISYVDQNDWGSGFTGNLSITNTGSFPINSWTVTWNYGGNQLLNQSWNSNYIQSGRTVSLSNAGWNASIAAGSTLSGIGWNATYSGTNGSPTAFYLNGTLCK